MGWNVTNPGCPGKAVFRVSHLTVRGKAHERRTPLSACPRLLSLTNSLSRARAEYGKVTFVEPTIFATAVDGPGVPFEFSTHKDGSVQIRIKSHAEGPRAE